MCARVHTRISIRYTDMRLSLVPHRSSKLPEQLYNSRPRLDLSSRSGLRFTTRVGQGRWAESAERIRRGDRMGAETELVSRVEHGWRLCFMAAYVRNA